MILIQGKIKQDSNCPQTYSQKYCHRVEYTKKTGRKEYRFIQPFANVYSFCWASLKQEG